MGHLSPLLNEKLAGYHAADLRADANLHRQLREARDRRAADPHGFGPAHDGPRWLGPHRFGLDRMWRCRERLAWALVGAGFSLLARHHGRSRRGAVVPMRGRGTTGPQILNGPQILTGPQIFTGPQILTGQPSGCGCDGK